jgi:hypothetical protein
MSRLRSTLLVTGGLFATCTGLASGQEPLPVHAGRPPHSVYIEAGGLPAFEGGPFTVNIEQRLLPATFLRAGTFLGQVDGVFTIKVPVLLNLVLPNATHNLELGAGIRWDAVGASSDDLRLASTIGYRYQELPGNSLLRAGLSFDLRSLRYEDDAWKFGPWPYLAVGLSF